MELVGAADLQDPEEDEGSACHADGEAEDVDDRKGFVADEVPPGDGEVVSNHWMTFTKVYEKFGRSKLRVYVCGVLVN